MAALTLVTYPHKILKQVASPVTEFDDTLANIAQSMIQIMYDEKGIGLAAPQVGLSQRILVIDISREQNNPLCLINPTITHYEGEQDSQEGCLSLPGLFTTLKRHMHITVQYQDKTGQWQTRSAEGLESAAIQHEIDHLEGLLFVDRLSPLKRSYILKKHQKAVRAERFE